MFKNKINKITEIISKIKTDITIPLISEFLDWFYEVLNLHFIKKEPKLYFKKGDIYFVNLGKNIGSELNKTRPCIIYSIKKSNFGNTVIIVPLKSYKGKKINSFQIYIEKNKTLGLEKNSIVDISGLKQVSKKRILNKIGVIDKTIIKEIDGKILKLFGI